MKDVRIHYKKMDSAKFASHLDTMRLMTRIMRKAQIPVWYTEGFNPHAYFNFALPLSLGFESNCEYMDMRITDDNLDLNIIKERLNDAFPVGFEVVDVYIPQHKFTEITYAQFNICFYKTDNAFIDSLNAFLESEEILCQKKNKKKQIVTFNAKPKIKSYIVEPNVDKCVLKLTVAAGCKENLNPNLIIKAFLDSTQQNTINYLVTQVQVFDNELRAFV